MSDVYYIGLATTFHDPALAIVDGEGRILFAEASERQFQNKRAIGCPADSVIWVSQILRKYCNPDAQFVVATSWSRKYISRIKTLGRLGLINRSPKGFWRYYLDNVLRSLLPTDNLIWILNQHLGCLTSAGNSLERTIRWEFRNHRIVRRDFEHHYSHAALACYGAGLKDAVCLVCDGGGEEGSISIYGYNGGGIKLIEKQTSSESLGFYYALLTDFCRFDPIRGEEWKVMGLAPYGKLDDSMYGLLKSMFYVEGCRLRYNLSPGKMRAALAQLKALGSKEGDRPEHAADMAFSGQRAYEEWMTEILRNLYKKGISENLILTGGCALNSAYNGKILSYTDFKTLYVPPAPADDGNALGAALLAYSQDKGKLLAPAEQLSPYLGSEISNESLSCFIKYGNMQKVRHLSTEICKETARLLAEGKLVGWVQGRAEFGPRSLGNRSILADPRSPEMKDYINSRVKFREEFRPFAPSILNECGSEYFEHYQESPYMERTLKFKESVRNRVPAVVHSDNTGRLQSVRGEWNSRYYQLLQEFYRITGVPMLLNTSFNVMSKPIIHSVEDAISVFYTTGLDVLVINDYLIEK